MAGSYLNVDTFVADAVTEHRLPAVSLAVYANGEMRSAAAGCLNIETGVEATRDSVFQIGSVTKVMTTCLVMQLVEEGLVRLDEPVRSYLPDFRVADKSATEAITVRHLLNHTSGIAGDFFPDDADAAGDLLARYVDRCNFLPLVHPVGKMASYSNAAFAIAGRLVEVMRRMSWSAAMREYVFRPLDMTHASADPKDSLRFRNAMGHVADDDAARGFRISPKTYLPLSLAPAGSTPMMRAEDLLLFAMAHMDAEAPGAKRLGLSAQTIGLMQTPAAELPEVSAIMTRSFGLGWILDRYPANDTTVVLHSGSTYGNMAMLQFVPERQLAFAVLSNIVRKKALTELVKTLQKSLFGIEPDEPDIDCSKPNDTEAGRYAGKYESLDAVAQVFESEGELFIRVAAKHDPVPAFTHRLVHDSGERFVGYNEKGERLPGVVFVRGKDTERPSYVYLGSRLAGRVDD